MYKTQATREVGKYKRTTSDSNVQRALQEHKPYRPLPELDSKDVAENTPNKPPRTKLGVNSPNQGRRSNSPNMASGSNQRGMPQVTSYQAPEVSNVQHAQKLVAKPLQGHNVQTLNSPTGMSNSSGSFVSTVVQRPAMNSAERNNLANEDATRPSVKDRVKNIEVFTHTPGSSKGNVQRSGQPNGLNKAFNEEKQVSGVHPQADSLEHLESSMPRNDSFRDRLRPVVKKSESDQSEEITPSQSSGASHRVSADGTDNLKTTPPQVPNRTYKHQHQSNSPGFRKDSFPNRGPKPFENKSNSSANIHSPLGQNNVMNSYASKPETVPEPKRSPGHSVPEPQVPSRSSRPSWASDHQLTRDQNANISSHDSRTKKFSDENVQNKENTQVHTGVHSGQKRNYDKSFSRTRNSSGGSSSNSSVSDPHSVHSFQNWHPGNTQSDKHTGGNSQRLDNKGENYSEQKQAYEQRTNQSRSRYNQSPIQRNQHPEQSHSSPANVHTQSPNSSRRSDPVDMRQNPSKDTSGQPEERHSSPVVVNHARQPSAEELECDQKAEELAKVLKESDKELSEVLTSESKKSRMQYLDGILPLKAEHADERRPRSGTKTEKQPEEKQEEKEE